MVVGSPEISSRQETLTSILRGTAVGLVKERKSAGEIVRDVRSATVERIRRLQE
jgi:hypothetical protein